MGKKIAETAVKGRDKTEKYRIGISQKEANAILIGLLGDNNQTMLRNIKSGEEVRLSKTSIGKLLSNSATKKSIDNGFTKEQHYAVASDIDNLFVNSSMVLEHGDKKGHPHVFINRFAAPLHFDNAVAYITIKETREPERTDKRIYTVELMEIKKFGGMLETVRKNPLTNFPAPNFNDENIQQLFNAVTNNI